MRKCLLLLLILFSAVPLVAQLEVKEGSFKEVPGFVNINPDNNYQTDDNNLPFAVIKVRTENINDKQRRELKFSGNAGTFIMLEYKDGEVWVYLTAQYADYLKISHPDFSSIEFTLPYDLKPKCGYEMILVNQSYLTEIRKSDIMSNKYCFSVSSNDKVLFSKGNLQYNPVTKIWRFAEKQWNYIGEANANVSSSYNGWIDLFGWGTGNNPTNCSTNNNDYVLSSDWLNLAISNGDGATWRTLTAEEWNYILYERDTYSGIRFAKAIVNGVNGLIILPDNWHSRIYKLSKTNNREIIYSSNIISQTNWDNKLEPNGAVFLPAAGWRVGVSVDNCGSHGHYWSYSCADSDGCYEVYFDESTLFPTMFSAYLYGHSIRMVRDL